MDPRLEHTIHQNAIGASLDQAETVQDHAKDDEVNDVPDGYWKSYRFIGSLTAIVLQAKGLYIGYVMPVCDEEVLPRSPLI